MKILQCTECGKDVEVTGKYASRTKSTICTDCSLASASPQALWWKEFHEKNRELLTEQGATRPKPSDADSNTYFHAMPSKSACPECGETFGNAWQGASLARHRWEAHGISGEATFNSHVERYGPPEQKPGDRNCPECGKRFGPFNQEVSFTEHRWKAHGIPGEATFEGKVYEFKRIERTLSFWERFQKAEFVDNNPPLNRFLCIFVAMPLSVAASAAVAAAIFYPFSLIEFKDFNHSSPYETCQPTPFGCE